MKRKMLALVLALTLAFSMASVASATDNVVSDEAQTAADALYQLGLFYGTGTDSNGNPIYSLEKSMDRHSAVTMLVRLLGKEEEAKSGTWETPFTDVAGWAKPYVGYAYANGLTAGTSATTFGGTLPVTAAQYLTFVLRALGYESGADFSWNKAWELSDKIGLTSGQYNAENNASFRREDCAIISYSGLQTALKNSEVTLIDKMVESQAVDYIVAGKHGLLSATRSIASLVKVGGTYYTYNTDLQPTVEVIKLGNLFFARQDIPIKRNSAATDISGFITHVAWAMLSDYKVSDIGNPYISKISLVEPGIKYWQQHWGNEETEWISLTESFTPCWVEINGTKFYNLRSDGSKYQVQNGVRYLDGKPCLNDIFEIAGINKKIVIGEYEGLTYVEYVDKGQTE